MTLSCVNGNISTVDILIRYNANLEIGASTPLIRSAQIGDIRLVNLLLESGANVHTVTSSTETALTFACENNHIEVADKLIMYDSNVVSVLFSLN